MQKSKYKIGENRLVFATKGQTDVPPSIAEAPTPSLSDLSKDIAKDPTNLNESIKRLGASWKDLTDATERITNIFKRFDVDVDEEEIEATLREPGANPDSADTTEAEPTDWKEKSRLMCLLKIINMRKKRLMNLTNTKIGWNILKHQRKITIFPFQRL